MSKLFRQIGMMVLATSVVLPAVAKTKKPVVKRSKVEHTKFLTNRELTKLHPFDQARYLTNMQQLVAAVGEYYEKKSAKRKSSKSAYLHPAFEFLFGSAAVAEGEDRCIYAGYSSRYPNGQRARGQCQMPICSNQYKASMRNRYPVQCTFGQTGSCTNGIPCSFETFGIYGSTAAAGCVPMAQRANSSVLCTDMARELRAEKIKMENRNQWVTYDMLARRAAHSMKMALEDEAQRAAFIKDPLSLKIKDPVNAFSPSKNLPEPAWEVLQRYSADPRIRANLNLMAQAVKVKDEREGTATNPADIPSVLTPFLNNDIAGYDKEDPLEIYEAYDTCKNEPMSGDQKLGGVSYTRGGQREICQRIVAQYAKVDADILVHREVVSQLRPPAPTPAPPPTPAPTPVPNQADAEPVDPNLRQGNRDNRGECVGSLCPAEEGRSAVEDGGPFDARAHTSGCSEFHAEGISLTTEISNQVSCAACLAKAQLFSQSADEDVGEIRSRIENNGVSTKWLALTSIMAKHCWDLSTVRHVKDVLENLEELGFCGADVYDFKPEEGLDVEKQKHLIADWQKADDEEDLYNVREFETVFGINAQAAEALFCETLDMEKAAKRASKVKGRNGTSGYGISRASSQVNELKRSTRISRRRPGNETLQDLKSCIYDAKKIATAQEEVLQCYSSRRVSGNVDPSRRSQAYRSLRKSLASNQPAVIERGTDCFIATAQDIGGDPSYAMFDLPGKISRDPAAIQEKRNHRIKFSFEGLTNGSYSVSRGKSPDRVVYARPSCVEDEGGEGASSFYREDSDFQPGQGSGGSGTTN